MFNDTFVCAGYTICVSSGQLRSRAFVSSAFSYAVPVVIAGKSNISIFPNSTHPAAPTDRHSIFLTGSGFGSFTSTTIIDAIVQPIVACVWCSTAVDLASADLSALSNQALITGVSLQIRIYNSEDPSAGIYRFDDIDLVLLSPIGLPIRLTRNKCFGTNPQSITLMFQLSSLNVLPVSRCSYTGMYAFPQFVDGTSLATFLATSSALGVWKLQISKSYPDKFSVSDVAIKFTVSDAIAIIGQTAVFDQIWTSDSSMKLAVAHGAGKAHYGKVVVKSQSSTGSFYFSYPVPDVISRNWNTLTTPRTSNVVVLIGKYFAVNDATARASIGSSVCQSSVWISDTSLICKAAPILNRVILSSVLATVQSQTSVTSIPLISFDLFRLYSSSYTNIENAGVATSSFVFFVGANLGCSSGSESVKLISSLSSAVASSWISDSSVFSKLQNSKVGHTGVWLSIFPTSRNFSEILVPTLPPPQIQFVRTSTDVESGKVASTGSVRLFVAGSSFRPYDTTVAARLGGSGCSESIWKSNSAVFTKASAGMASSSTVIVGSAGTSNGSAWNSPHIFQSPSASHLTTTLAENISQVNGSGFGVFNSLLLQVNQVPAVVNWTSDSSISCRVLISRDPFNLELVFFTSNSGNNPSVSAVSRSVVQNPVFVASPKPIAQSLNSLIYIPMPAVVESNLNLYIQKGSSSGWSFPAQQFSTLPSFLFSEPIPIDIVIFNNHTQVYLKNYLPIRILVFGQISIMDTDGVVLNSLICFGNASVTFDLPPNSFANLLRTSIAICSATPILFASINFSFSVLNEMGDSISFVSHSAAFSVQSRPSAILQSPMGIVNLAAGYNSRQVLNASLSNVGDCSRLVLQYTTNLSCISGSSYVPAEFYPNGLCDNSNSAVSHTDFIHGTCFLKPQWTYGVAGKCVISFELPRFQVSVAIPVTILTGVPKYFSVVGRVMSSLTGGGIIWSSNASGSKCLVLRFRDRCNNTRSIGGFSCELSASLMNSSQYPLLGPSTVIALSNGECSWCSTRTSLPSPLPVKLEMSCSEIVKDFVSLLNVTGLGEPAAVKVLSPSLNNSSVAGMPAAPITFRITDATGAPVPSGLTTVVRVRILRRTKIGYACFSILALIMNF